MLLLRDCSGKDQGRELFCSRATTTGCDVFSLAREVALID